MYLYIAINNQLFLPTKFSVVPTTRIMTDITMSIVDDESIRTAEFAGISSYARDTSSWPWVEKYRPSTLDDIIAHKEIVSTINQLVDKQKLPHLLFYGPPGTGKTSMIIAIARKIYGKHFSSMVLEVLSDALCIAL